MARRVTTGGCFYLGDSPAAEAPPRGKRMVAEELDTQRLLPRHSDQALRDDEVSKMELATSTLKNIGASSEAPHRGKKMFGEAAHSAQQAYLFVPYGSFPSPAPRPYGRIRDPPEESLRGLLHTGNTEARDQDIEKISETPSVFDKNFEGLKLHGFYQPPRGKSTSPPPLSVKRVQRGLLDSVMEHSDTDHRIGKRVATLQAHAGGVPESIPIPGFPGLGPGQMSRFEQIKPKERRETMPPMQPYFGTHHDLKYGVHGFTTCPPAPPEEERSGWFNWVEDRQKCPLNDAGFDPLKLKADYCSPGDPLNRPQRMKRIDIGTPATDYLLHGKEPPSPPNGRIQCVKMFSRPVAPDEELIQGFHGLGDAAREARNDRPRGTRKLSPHHEQPRRPKAYLLE